MTEPDIDECSLVINDLGVELDRWSSYQFSSHFATPTDAFTFTVGDPEVLQGISGKIREGMRVTLLCNQNALCSGYIDEIEYAASRSSGTELHINGRDILGDVVDSVCDPTLRFQPTQPLLDILTPILSPFGIRIFDDGTNFEELAGVSVHDANKFGLKNKKPSTSSGSRRRRRRRRSGKKAPSAAVAHECKPYPHEGCFEFCARLAKRQGWHIWARADGEGVIIGDPDFEQEPTYTITRRRGSAGALNNVINGTVTRSRTNQPSVIIATGVGGGGEFSCGKAKVAAVNELISVNTDGSYVQSVKDVLAKHPDAVLLSESDFDGDLVIRADSEPYPRARPLFLHDDDSRDIEQLKNFVKRELGTRQQGNLTCHYEVLGHTQNNIPWEVNTTVVVDDDVADIHETMWVLSVNFSKSRYGGTTTRVEVIRLWSLRL